MGIEMYNTTFETCIFVSGDLIQSFHRSIVHNIIKLETSQISNWELNRDIFIQWIKQTVKITDLQVIAFNRNESSNSKNINEQKVSFDFVYNSVILESLKISETKQHTVQGNRYEIKIYFKSIKFLENKSQHSCLIWQG